MKCPKCQTKMSSSMRKWNTVTASSEPMGVPGVKAGKAKLHKCPKCGYMEVKK